MRKRIAKSEKPKKNSTASVSSRPKESNQSEENSSQNEDHEGELNFGGLPSRDLKKNLGCG